MADIAGLLKSEISRLSKKVMREYIDPIRATTTQNRRQLATLKKQVLQLQREISKLRRIAPNTPTEERAGRTKNRFVAKGFKSLRARLSLSADDFGRILGVSTQTIYNWESEKTTPRAEQVAAIAQLRGIGKKAAQARLESLAPEAPTTEET
jgi:DNA-binding transcriptional regulator YiaG